VLPNLGFGMEEGRLVAWLKSPGEAVRKGEALAEIEGDKATVELEAVVDGVLEEIRVAPDTVVPVGAVLARIRTTSSAAAIAPQLPSVEETAPKVQSKPAEPVQASPVACRPAQSAASTSPR
jgi:pyruvate/2-oxoglutarate dehydrogenase complex dihydrolipoamide acyltransferase (E2) component